ncbi:uncharacterized protein LOC141679223 [Apium graveolens]|uniref:uncharacterized protein LOC141679223 n=1 Tax=Apium graveolens TaxID=4045 RepID=UPI003D78C819
MTTTSIINCQTFPHQWKPPATGSFKLNTDASFKVGEGSFSIGLLLRDHQGKFIVGKVQRLVMVSSVLEAEVIAIREGLHWLASLPYQNVEVESDSLLAVQAIKRPHDNILEVGFALDECQAMIQSRSGVSIIFAKRQANRAAWWLDYLVC